MFKLLTNLYPTFLHPTSLSRRSVVAVPLALMLSSLGCSESTTPEQNSVMPDGDGSDSEGGESTSPGAGGEADKPMDGAGGTTEPGPDQSGAGGMSSGSGGEDTSGGAAGAPTEPPSGELTVVSVSPEARGLTADVMAPLVIEFDRPVDEATVSGTTLWAFGRWSGPVRDGAYTYSEDKKTVTLTSPRAWSAGDRITVVISHDVAGTDGKTLRQAGYSFQYWTKSQPAPLTAGAFTELQKLSTGPEKTIAYGGSAADLNGDSFLDLMVINEESADMRVFMNMADGTGMFERLEGSFPLDDRASPSEPTDFNGDGMVDVVVANLDGDNISILFGKGDGTFEPSQKIDVGDQPRGVAVFDFDGDGDIDIANTNASSDNMSVLLNDGTGKFPEVDDEVNFYFFNAGDAENTATQEWGLMSGDMNEDGILDLVIGARGRLEGNEVINAGVVIHTGVGEGKFEFASMSGPETMPWQLAVGDLNGDGHEDVATADGALTQESKNTVTMLLGDGATKLEPKQTYSENIEQPFAIDIGDLDGDGDMDVVVSNYAANWEILSNDGTSQMTLVQSVESDDPGGIPGSASCALLMDIDNDGDLDLALVDENEDQVVFLQH